MAGEEAEEALKQTFWIPEMRKGVWRLFCVSLVWSGMGEVERMIRHQIGRYCYPPNHYLPIVKHALFWHRTGRADVSECRDRKLD